VASVSGFAWKNDLFILAWTKHAHESPVGYRDGNTEESGEEKIGLEATAIHEREDAFE